MMRMPNHYYNQPDTIFAQLYNVETHIYADLFSSWWYPLKERRVIIVGNKGAFMWIDDNLSFTKTHYEKKEGHDKYGNFGNHLVESPEEKIALDINNTPLELQLGDFLSHGSPHLGHLMMRTWSVMNKITTYTPKRNFETR